MGGLPYHLDCDYDRDYKIFQRVNGVANQVAFSDPHASMRKTNDLTHYEGFSQVWLNNYFT